MQLQHTFIAVSLIAALSACTAGQEKNPNTKPAQEPAPANVADPMASSARMVGGEWRLTFQSGTSMYSTSHWGPGNHSMRTMTHGFDAAGNPWRELAVAYWHPGRKQLCMLGLGPWKRGVSEGVITVEGEASEAVIDDYEIGAHRKLVARSVFDGPDKFRSELLEMTGPDALTSLTGWDIVRSWTLTPVRPLTAEQVGRPSDYLKVLEPFLGKTWDAKGDWGTGDAFHIETTFEWIPLADAIYARSFALRGNGMPTHVFDAYFYHHTGTGRLRCLALSDAGGVYEGDVTVLDGGALQFDMKGNEGGRVAPYVVRFEFEPDGTLHQRVWSLDGAERTLMLDVHHTGSNMSKNIMAVFQDKKGNYWFGSDVQGVYRYDGKTITQFTTKDGLCCDQVRGIQEDKSGNIYFTTLNGISKFDGQAFATLSAPASNSPMTEWKLQPDDLWFPGAQDAGVAYRYDGTTLHRLGFPRTKLGDEIVAKYPRSQFPNVKFSPYDVYTVSKDSKGNIWFGTASLGACRYDGTSFAWISEKELEFGDMLQGDQSFGVRSIVEDDDGSFWFGNSRNRFSVGQDKSSISFKKEKGAGKSPGLFMSGTKDDHGDLWMATYGAGVWRYDGEKLTHYSVTEAGQTVTLFSIYKDNQGVLWLGTHEAGTYRFNGKTFERFTPVR